MAVLALSVALRLLMFAVTEAQVPRQQLQVRLHITQVEAALVFLTALVTMVLEELAAVAGRPAQVEQAALLTQAAAAVVVAITERSHHLVVVALGLSF